MEKIKKLLAKIEKSRLRLDPKKESLYRTQLEKLLNYNFTDAERLSIKELWDQMDIRTLDHAKTHLMDYREKAKTTFTINDKNFELKNWATISQYAKIYGYKNTEAISNKIKRGTIPAENIVLIPELDIKLIKL